MEKSDSTNSEQQEKSDQNIDTNNRKQQQRVISHFYATSNSAYGQTVTEHQRNQLEYFPKTSLFSKVFF